MKNTVYDVVIVGAGIAGLSASYYLKKLGLDHLVFERGKIGESWRSQRWDSFRLNSIRKLSTLPGMKGNSSDLSRFDSAGEYVSSFREYVSTFDLPVVENAKVLAVEKDGDLFRITVSEDGTPRLYNTKQVIIASGCATEIKVPSFAKNISPGILQLHTSEYRNPSQLPEGAVLVVGSAQSGVQIAEDLADGGRKVFLSTSMVARVPRWYRGKDIMEWLIEMNFFDIKANEIEDPKMLQMRPPQITGTGGNRYTISLQSLARKGVTIVGKTDKIDGDTVFFQPNAAMHVMFADGFSQKVKEMIDGFIVKMNLDAEKPVPDEADVPDATASCANPMTTLNLAENNITSIVWSTGFGADYSYIKLPVFDEQGNLRQQEGIPIVQGLYFLGYPWLTSRRSVLIFGIVKDAEFIANKVYEASVGKTHAAAV